MFKRSTYKLSPITPTVMILDADEERAQRLGHILCLSGYRPLIETTLYQAFERTYREQVTPHALLLGQADLPQHHLFSRFMGRLGHQIGRSVYLIPALFRGVVPNELPLGVKHASPSSHTLSPQCLSILTSLSAVLPSMIRYQNLTVDTQALTLRTLPAEGIFPRLSHHKFVRNSYFLQALKAANLLIDNGQWESLIGDVGLAAYRSPQNWPIDADTYTIPAEHLSLLQQAIILSQPDNSLQLLQQWGSLTTDNALQKRGFPLLAQQAIKLLRQENKLQTVLKTFANQMNEIRLAELHELVPRYNGTYWLVHYSNLYAYGRINSLHEPGCHFWTASIERVLQQVGLDTTWQVVERECSCQTLTGHCIFEIAAR